jgi:succinate dehydrogenase / fumarate reductase flavoprotein subunit
VPTYLVHDVDLVVIGGGLAGLRGALPVVHAGLHVALVSKVHPLRSHSVAAAGGINAALGNAQAGEDDSWERHAGDTIKASDYLADQDVVELMCRDAVETVIELERMGAVFSRLPDGRIAQRPFSGGDFPRTCYASDRTGHNLLHALYEQATANDETHLRFYDEFFVTSLVVAKGRCIGCIALDIKDGVLHGFAAKAVLLATGGYGRVYARSTNALINTGDGAALALRAGAPLEDMEFVQFHPTTLYGTNILIGEAARAEGGYLLNNRNERFMKNHAPQAMELAPRDVVARAIQKEVDSGRGFENEYVRLDLTHLGDGRIQERLPGIRRIAMDFAGVDPAGAPIPVQPGQHYSMGGVAAGKNGATPLPGLYAAGECACLSVHGANRLGGNSLLEAVAFGKRAGQAIAQAAPDIPLPAHEPIESGLDRELSRITELVNRDRGERISAVRDDLRMMMFELFGIFREESQMKDGLRILANLKDRYSRVGIGNRSRLFNQALVNALELENMLLVSEAIGLSALERRESRGAHARSDYPQRNDDNYRLHSMAWLRGAGIELLYQPVKLALYPVKEREY